jgi:NADPH2 dehydrogenase
MNPQHIELFAPTKIGKLVLRNRIVAPPMVQVRPITSREGIAWYRRLAAGGASLVIVEATGIPHFGNELTAKTLRPLVDAVHQEGAAIAIQLFPIVFGTTADPNALSAEQLKSIVAGYGNAAAICREAGFDAVEPHGAHGYLLNQFFMPDRNHRTDDYGGSFENRCRLGVEIVERIRRVGGDSLLIFYRHTPTGPAYTLEESVAFAEDLAAVGLDVIDVSPSRKDFVADLAAAFKAALRIPVIAVNGMNRPDAAAEALREDRCDLVAIGRGLIADATWPIKVSEERYDEILECRDCNAGCFGNLKRGKPVKCVQWATDEVAPFAT